MATLLSAMLLMLVVSVGLLTSGNWWRPIADILGRPRLDVLTCVEVIALAETYLDGDLEAERADQVEQHLAFCEQCRRHFDQLRQDREPVDRPDLEDVAESPRIGIRIDRSFDDPIDQRTSTKLR